MFQIARQQKGQKVRNKNKRIKVFVEGDSEKYYFDSLKRVNKYMLTIECTNLKGGGYTDFVNELKKHSPQGYVATFLILDLDKYQDKSEERPKFDELQKYCNQRNENDEPTFMFGNYRDIEVFFAHHYEDYKNRDAKKFLSKKFSTEYNKADSKIYEKLNKGNSSYTIANKRLKTIKTAIKNEYDISDRNFEWKNTIKFDDKKLNVNNSNIFEMFQILQ